MIGPSIVDVDAAIDHLLQDAPSVRPQHPWEFGRSGSHGLHDQLRQDLRRVTRAELSKLPGLQLHAAACRLPSDKGLLLAGRSGAGKSTLMAALASEMNASVVSDDTVVLQDGCAHGLGVPLTIRRTSPYWDLANRLWYTDDSDRLLIHPRDLGGALVAEARIDTVVFPQFGGQLSVRPISSADSFCRLSSMLMRPADNETLLELARFAARTRSFSAKYGSVDEALAAIAEVAGSDPAVDVIVPRPMRSDELVGFPTNVWGMRFNDEVILFNQSTNEVAHLAGWPADMPSAVTSWPVKIEGHHVDS
jgi:energy-coupling factor transporter ATP-binding protein EcfA2